MLSAYDKPYILVFLVRLYVLCSWLFSDFDCRMAALHQAALVGNTDIMNLLLGSGAVADIKDVKGKFDCIL